MSFELKLTKNGGVKAAEKQIIENGYNEPFKADGHEIVPIAIELENANKLVRQYITKDMDISKITDKRIAAIQAKINARPRKKLNFNTPKQEFYKHYI